MKSAKSVIAIGVLAGSAMLGHPAGAQEASFEQLVYLSCQDAQDMPAEQRKAVAESLAMHSASHHGVPWPLPEELSDDAGLLVRGICTMYPDGNLFAIINRVVETTFVGS